MVTMREMQEMREMREMRDNEERGAIARQTLPTKLLTPATQTDRLG